jgi:NlpC/P60 family putative phage cell wall peptidase
LTAVLATPPIIGAQVVDLARGWIGTPYHHQASVKGVGCDCLGLVRGIYAELYGRPAADPPPYSRDLAEATGRETLIEAASEHLTQVLFGDVGRPGDVLIFRLRAGAMAKHCAIAASPARMIHAFEGAPVCEVVLSTWWQRRIAAVFHFPETPRT